MKYFKRITTILFASLIYFWSFTPSYSQCPNYEGTVKTESVWHLPEYKEVHGWSPVMVCDESSGRIQGRGEDMNMKCMGKRFWRTVSSVSNII